MTSIIRYSNWEERLKVYIDRVEWEPYRWGVHDCALFVAGAINAQTGVDPAAEFRGTYNSKTSAAKSLREHGAGTLLKTVRQWLGESKSVSQAKRGDIVMLNATTTGVCVGQYSWFVGQEQGFERLAIRTTASCRYAFTVPFGE